MEIIARDADLLHFFQSAVATRPDHADALARYVVNELLRELGDRPVTVLPFAPAALADLVALIESGAITGSAAREVLAAMAATGGDPRAVMEQKGLQQINDSAAIGNLAREVMAAHPDKVAAYRGGRTGLLGFLVGQVMQNTGGRANPELVKAALQAELGG